jgi:hypothetical protein
VKIWRGCWGGELGHSNYHSGRGEPFVIILEFTVPKDMDGSGNSNLLFRLDMVWILALEKAVYVLESMVTLRHDK